MHEWIIERHQYSFLIDQEDEDTGKHTILGIIEADTMSQALDLAAQYCEVDVGELVATRVQRIGRPK